VQIKRFEAENITQALKAVKAELGTEAVILETRRLGGKGRSGVQVTAAFEAPAAAPARAPLATLPAEGPSPGQGQPVDPPWAKNAAPRNAAPRRAATAGPSGGVRAGAGPAGAPTLAQLQSVLSPLREEITAIGAGLEALRGPGHPELASVSAELARLRTLVSDLVVDRRASALADGPRAAYHALTARGLPKDLAADLAGALPDGDPDRLAETLASRLPVTGPLLAGGAPRRVLLAGPTGVGKTTTIAKLAAYHAVTEKRRVALITLDTYRIGAVEQFATYARIIGVPSAVASDRAELDARLAEMADADLVLIDTAGRSPKDEAHVEGLARIRPPGVEVQLVLPATRPVADHRAILDAYAPLEPAALVMTKLDEAEALGAALQTALTAGTPLSYVTDGQRVPEDLHLASARRLAARLMDGMDGGAR
jgi:flagellar biosynthesis protein FlhF